jgi:hypothetical protein
MSFDACAFVARELAKPPTGPSKRAVKNKSGRSGRRQSRGSQAMLKAGGYASPVSAIYEGKDGKDKGFRGPRVRKDDEGLHEGIHDPGWDYHAPQGQLLGRVPCV